MKLPSWGQRTRNECRTKAGCIVRSPDANFKTRGSAKGFENCLSRSGAPSPKPYPLLARIGVTQRLHIGFSPMIASTRKPHRYLAFALRAGDAGQMFRRDAGHAMRNNPVNPLSAGLAALDIS
jgi:hypothetical protein